MLAKVKSAAASEGCNVSPASRSKKWQLGGLARLSAPFAVFGALWYLLIVHLSQWWAVEPEYSFGWLVPILCAYLFLIRWRNRPRTEIPDLRVTRWIFWIAGFGLLPTWVIAQSNPDWRLICWLLAVETVALSLCAIYFTGGTSWLRHFAFSICLILTAVPWPYAFEETVVHGSTQLSTALTVAALNLLRIHAVQHGNLVELRSGLVGIDEACSGIRSLQAAFMMSLFLGELYSTSISRRSLLVLCSAGIAFVCNAGRMLSLAAVAAKGGIQSIANWHDPLGYVALTTCFLLILGVARLISGPLPTVTPAAAKAPVGSPSRLIFGLGGWILFTVIGTEIWYQGNETTETLHWSVAWPVHKRGFADIPISKVEAELLLFNEGRGAEWTDADGSHWVAYFFKWTNGTDLSQILARRHRPEICFPAAGYKPCEDHGIITIQAKDVSIPFHALDFEDGENKEFVFFCVWEEGMKNLKPPPPEYNPSWLERLRSVLLGQRNLGQQTLEIVISGYDSPEKAETAFRREIVTLIKRTDYVVVDVANR
jgi:exosortase